MSINIQAEIVINTLKKSFNWKNDATITANKIPLNLYCDFVKLRFITKNAKAEQAFENFKKDTNNLKFEGKLETWIEISIENNKDKIDELKNKIEKVEAFYEKYMNISDEKTDKMQNIEIKESLNDTKKTDEDNENTDTNNEQNNDNISEKPILVTWDFSKVSEFALEHAIYFTKIVKGQVYLLNIAKKEKDIDKIEKQFEHVISETYKKYGVNIKTIVTVGNIFKTITDLANKKEAKLVIMGTHGVKGIQKFTGSWALKVIVGTNTPFVVVHDKPKNKEVKDIVFGIDHTKENKQMLKQAKLLANNNNVKFHLVLPDKISNSQILKNTKINLVYVKNYFKQNNIDFDVNEVNDTYTSADATLKYTENNKSDLIIVLTTKNINIQDYVLGADEQRIIANPSKIPVMCINPNKVKYSTYSSFANS